jgi:branched-chain amino acid transport system ATP-binding protein
MREFLAELFPSVLASPRKLARSLPAAERQQLTLARGLMGIPRLLLVDEPSVGLVPDAAGAIFLALRRLGAEGITVLMAEENPVALSYAERAFMMEEGRVSFEGTGPEVATKGSIKVTSLGVPA